MTEKKVDLLEACEAGIGGIVVLRDGHYYPTQIVVNGRDFPSVRVRLNAGDPEVFVCRDGDDDYPCYTRHGRAYWPGHDNSDPSYGAEGDCVEFIICNPCSDKARSEFARLRSEYASRYGKEPFC